MASADLGASVRRNAAIASPLLDEGSISDHVGDAGRGDRTHDATVFDGITSSTVVEPVSIAVFGFAAAALIAVRRRKIAKPEDDLAAQRIS